jgi:hypothetical protein
MDRRQPVSNGNADYSRQREHQVHPAATGDYGGYFHDDLTIPAVLGWD